MAEFFQNVSHMTAGSLFVVMIAFLVVPIMVRAVGIEAYAVIGICFSLFNLLRRFDIPYYLSFVKCASDKECQRKVFANLYYTVLFGNLVIFLVVLPVIYLLSNAYGIPNLPLYYFLALCSFLLGRVVQFHCSFYRSCGREKRIQKIMVFGHTFEFLLLLVLLFVFNLGVLSIFLASVISKALESGLFFFKTREYYYQTKFSLNVILSEYRQTIADNYIAKILGGVFIWGGFMIASLYLSAFEIGFLGIIIGLSTKLDIVFLSIWSHLIIKYEELKNKTAEIRLVNRNILTLLMVGFLLTMGFLFTIGQPLFKLYLGKDISVMYPLFVIFITGYLFFRIFLPLMAHLFMVDIRKHNLIFFVRNVLFLVVLVVLTSLYGLSGTIIAYTTGYILVTAVFFLISLNDRIGSINMEEYVLYFSVFIVTIAGLLFHQYNIGLFSLLYIVIILIFYLKRIRGSVRFIYTEI